MVNFARMLTWNQTALVKNGAHDTCKNLSEIVSMDRFEIFDSRQSSSTAVSWKTVAWKVCRNNECVILWRPTSLKMNRAPQTAICHGMILNKWIFSNIFPKHSAHLPTSLTQCWLLCLCVYALQRNQHTNCLPKVCILNRRKRKKIITVNIKPQAIFKHKRLGTFSNEYSL